MFSSYVSVKKKSVGGSIDQSVRASTGLVGDHCAVAMSPKVICVAPEMLPLNTFSLSLTVLELLAELRSNSRQVITIRHLWRLKSCHCLDASCFGRSDVAFRTALSVVGLSCFPLKILVVASPFVLSIEFSSFLRRKIIGSNFLAV